MNPTLREVLERYDQFLATYGVESVQVVDRAAGRGPALGHLRWMIRELLTRAESDGWSDRKVNRWLGFIQGTMWGLGATGIVSLRDDSRHLYPDERSIPTR